MRAGWRAIKLGDVCTLLNGRAYKQDELLNAGKYPVLRVGNFFSNRNWYYSTLELEPNKYCDEGDLLYAWSASFGPKIWRGGKVIYHYHIWKTALDEKQVDKMFLYYWFDWDSEKIKADQGAGTTMIHVTKGAMENRNLLLPTLDEQKRIVAILDKVFEGTSTAITNAEKSLANALELFEGYLNSAFIKGRKGWAEKKLGDIAEFKNGLNFTKGSRGEVINIVGVKDFQKNFYVPIDRLETAQIDGRLRADYELRAGDILTVRSNGNKQLIGRCMLAKDVPEKTSHSGFTIRIRAAAGEVLPAYLAHFLKSKSSREALIESGDGANISSLNQHALSTLPISLPPFSEQPAITERIQAIEAETKGLENVCRQKLDNLAELKQAILHKAFAGELTIRSVKVVQEAAE